MNIFRSETIRSKAFKQQQSAVLPAVKIVVSYSLFASLWIVLSDSIIESIAFDKEYLSTLQTAKGLAFVIITTLFVLVMVFRFVKSQKATETYLRTLLETIPDLVWLKDQNGKYLACNPKYEQFIGAVESELVGKTDYDFVSAEKAGSYHEKDRAAIISGNSFTTEEKAVFADSDRAEVLEVIKTPLIDSAGNLTGVLGIAREITALKQAERKFRSLVEGSIQGIYIHRDWKILFANTALVEILGYDSVPELLDLPSVEMIVAPHDVERLKSIKLAGESGEDISSRYEAQFLTKSGNMLWLESINEMIDWEGEPSVQSTVIDITERKLAEAALKESEEKYRSIFESTTVGMIVVNDNQGEIIEWNLGAEKAFGYSAKEILGKQLSLLIPERHLKSHTEGFSYALKYGELKHSGVSHDLTGVRKNGEEFPLQLTLSCWKRDGHLFFSAIVLDSTERERREARIRTLSQAIEQSPVSVIITDTNGDIEYVNSTFEQVTGYSSGEVGGKNPKILKSGKTSRRCYQELWKTICAGKAWRGELQNRKKNGDLFWEQAHIAPVVDEAGSIRHFLAVKEDITQRKLQDERILHQAHYDQLTDLPNRFLALDRLSLRMKEADRNKERVAVLFLDLDDFKKVNDTLGHDTGDNALLEAAKRLQNTIRGSDTVGRLGGDEFIVILGGLEEAKDASLVAEHLLHRFREPFSIGNRELMLTLSIGIAVYPDDGETPLKLLRNADSALYYSKAEGRNTLTYYTEEINDEVSRRFVLEEQLRGALDRQELRLCFQSQVDVSSERIVGVEALLRWHNPTLGNVSPVEFIPVAEHTGLIVPIGEFVIKEALTAVVNWHLEGKCGLKVAVNLSPRQFRSANLVEFIRQSLNQSGVSGEFLELEITEGLLMSGHSYISDALSALGQLGVSIAMDDFGTGYSSLSYLRSYPFDVLKIDRSFVQGITQNKGDRELVKATITMAHGLGMKVLAEGVETDDQFRLLGDLGCDMAQGYLFSHPISAEEMFEKL
ncbi:PAS domain S-box protein [Motiliproteus sp. MSK22-1]|uniref:sensor domain-containing protein n=1 Tax=Motiliproteus sp. MSK22-1 TaxID=1897630 RepID=UPI0009780412|nr:PAS domain S-box protein [Motiliproteus sp. MSK22-1]OMH27152.1 hypothetical protein BGP75_22835 [Motiliproteus sp. MSK22-1]